MRYPIDSAWTEVIHLTTIEPDWEYGIKTEGHQNTGNAATTVTLGENGFEYWTSGLNWGDLPDGWVYKEGTSVAIDSNDQVYVFNRGTCPMITVSYTHLTLPTILLV